MDLTRLKNNKVVVNSSWIIYGKIIQLSFSFVIGILTARYLGPQNYGILNLAMAYTSFAIPFCTLGISNVIVKEFVDVPEDEGVLLGSGIASRLFSSMLAIIVLAVIVYTLHIDNPILICTTVICSFTLIFKAFDLFEYWYQSKLLSKISTNICIVAHLISVAYRMILLVLKKNIYWFAFAYVLDLIIIAVMYLIRHKEKDAFTLSFQWKTCISLLRQSYHYILSSVMVVAYAQMDKIMIGKMMDMTSVGLYSTAVTICGLWTFILQAVIDSARPSIIKLRSLDREKYLERIVQLYSVVIWISIFVSLVICIFAPLLIDLFFGKEYHGSISPLRIVTWYTCFSYLGVARNIWSICEQQQKFEKIFAFIGAFSNAILNAVLIIRLGIVGAAIASLLTQVVTNILAPYCFKETRENAICVLKAFNLKYIFSLLKNL